MTPSGNPTNTVPINLCEPGDVLAGDVHNDKGQKVVSSETELTPKLIKRLVGAGISRVDVYGKKEVEVDVEKPDPAEETAESAGPSTKEEDGRLVIDEDLKESYVGEGDVTLEGDLDEGAVLSARGDIQVLGEIKDGTVRAMSGEINIEGNIKTKGNTVQLISNKPIQVNTVVDSELSVRGHLIVNGTIKNAEIDCLGNLIVHKENEKANITDSRIEVEGQLMADQITGEDSGGSHLSFRDPEVVKTKRNRQKTESKLEELNQEAEKLKHLVNTVKELGDQVKSLAPEKKKQVKERTEKYKSIRKRIDEANQDLEDYEERLEEIRSERRYFMRVLNRLQGGTTINYEKASTTIDEDEHNVRLYKKGMIVIQDASDIPFRLEEWLTD